MGSKLMLFAPNMDQLCKAVIDTGSTLAMLNAQFARQAASIGCLDDFEMRMSVMPAMIPLLFSMRGPAKPPAGSAPAMK